MIQVHNKTYELIDNNKDGWDLEAFEERYSDILDKYDYIVGDWGYDKLRLSGFYRNSKNSVPEELRIRTLEDFLIEYCNFGCAYFVLKRIKNNQKEK